MKRSDYRWRLAGFMLLWFLLNLLQAAFTELNPDEAYYWAYSRELDWGYFDHPPMIALMIRIGSALLPGELGVRFMTVLLSTVGIWVLWLLAGKPSVRSDLNTLLLLFAAMPMLQVYAFVATPDSPLLFFALLFFFVYDRFVRHETWSNALLLGAVMAAMLYSKYHGILVIGFMVLSNLRLLRQPRFYAAALFGVLLFIPHLYWQYSNEFPSLRYHLLGRNEPFQGKDLYYYLLNQLVIFNPFIIYLLVIALLHRSAAPLPWRTELQRGFRWLIYGFWLFFLLMVMRGHVEPHWLAVMSFPFLLLAYHYSLRDERYRRCLQRLILASFAVFGLARIAILDGVLENELRLFHERQWVYELEEEVGDAPVLFLNSFRDPSTYAFYTGRKGYALNSYDAARSNQYSLWDWEKRLQGQRVAVVGPGVWDCAGCRLITTDKQERSLKWADDFQASQQVRFSIKEIGAPWRAGATQTIKAMVHNPYNHPIRPSAGTMPLRPAALFQDADGRRTFIPLEFQLENGMLAAGGSVSQQFTFRLPAQVRAPFFFGLGIQTGEIPPVWQSEVWTAGNWQE